MGADRKIKKLSRYTCGIVSDEERDALGCGDLFFESPDGQNGLLYRILTKDYGFRNAGYNAEYYWKVRKDGFVVAYSEGDISIYQDNK